MNDKSKLTLHRSKLEQKEKESKRFHDLFEDSNETPPTGSNTLEAFKVFDDINLNTQKKSSKSNRDSKHFDDYQIYNFLEREYNRLKQIDTFFSQKLELLANYPQGEKLLAKQTKKATLIKQELISLLMEYKSPMNIHLEDLWDNSF